MLRSEAARYNVKCFTGSTQLAVNSALKRRPLLNNRLISPSLTIKQIGFTIATLYISYTFPVKAPLESLVVRARESPWWYCKVVL